jgi:hypothetical protein
VAREAAKAVQISAQAAAQATAQAAASTVALEAAHKAAQCVLAAAEAISMVEKAAKASAANLNL